MIRINLIRTEMDAAGGFAGLQSRTVRFVRGVGKRLDWRRLPVDHAELRRCPVCGRKDRLYLTYTENTCGRCSNWAARQLSNLYQGRLERRRRMAS